MMRWTPDSRLQRIRARAGAAMIGIDTMNDPGPSLTPFSTNSWSPFRVMVATLVVLGVLLGAWVIVQISTVVLIVVLGLVFAAAIEPLVYRIRRAGLPRSQAIGLAYLIVFGIVGGILYFIVPQFVHQFSELNTAVPGIFQTLREQTASSSIDFIRTTGYQTVVRIESTYNGFRNSPSIAKDQAFGLASSIAGGLFIVASMLIVAFYWLTEKATAKRLVLDLFPLRRRARAHAIWDEIEFRLGGWTRGQLTLMAVIGTISGIGFFIIGVPYWLALAFLAGLTEAIPYIGPVIGGATAFLVALSDSTHKALAVAIFVFAVQQLEGNVLVPRIMKNAVGMSPLTVTIAVMIGGVLYGPIGTLLSIPLGAVAQVLVTNLTRLNDDRITSELRYMELSPISALLDDPPDDQQDHITSPAAPR
ncbi:MAG: AI-2E family transporter [Thermomicrobiales bacterium]